MRCLYCDKKLSLLKLAKGDSFCSPEHFDAHQLRISKSGFQHLIGPSVEKTPAAPVAQTPPEEEKRVGKEELEVVAPPALQPPPVAPFSTSELIPFPPDATLFSVNAPDAPRPKLALPVHDVEFNGCLLNLYLQMRRSETTAFNWVAPCHPIVTPLDFRPDLTRPPLALSPDFPRIEDAAETEPVEPPSAASRLAFLLAPSFRERTTPAIFLDTAPGSVPTHTTLAPILNPSTALRPDSSSAISKSTLFAQAASLEARDSTSLSIRSAPERAFSPGFVLPAAKGEAHLDGWHASSRLIGLTGNAVEMSWQSVRTLEFDPPSSIALLVRPDAVLVQSLRPLRIPSAQVPVSLTINPISPSVISTPELPRSEEPPRAFPVAPAAGTPQQRATMLPRSLFVSVLETRPLQQEVVFVQLLCPLESGLRSVLAKFPAGEQFSSAFWSNQAPHFPLPESTSNAPALPAFQLQPISYSTPCLKRDPSRVQAPSLTNQPHLTIVWRETHSGIPSSALPRPAVAPPPLCLSGPDTSRKLEMVSSVALPVPDDRAFAPAPSVLLAALDVTLTRWTALPQIVGDPAGNVRIGLAAPSSTWDPLQLTPDGPRIARFLPVRKSPILPSAMVWPRLASLPR